MPYNKIVYGDKVLIDLTGDTLTPDKLLKSYTGHDKSGAAIVGTCTYDSDTTDATAAVAETIEGKTFYARGQKLTGTMPNKGSVQGVISEVNQEFTIPQGYHDGGGKVGIDTVEKAKIIAANIKSGVQILGIVGSYGGEAVKAQTKSATPSTEEQTILPDAGYDYLSSVTMGAIPYVESENSAGGTTVTIG